MAQEKHTIRVVLIDDNKSIHTEIGGLLRVLDGIRLVAEGYDGQEAIALCQQHRPDVVLMDVAMPVMDGITATRQIKRCCPETRIIALSGIDDTRTVQEMLIAGASGYVLKDAHPEEIESTIHAVYSGQSVISAALVRPLITPALVERQGPESFGLTRREMEVLRAMSDGLNNGEVADKLYISTATVRFHLTNIIEKLGAENRTEALIIAARHGLI